VHRNSVRTATRRRRCPPREAEILALVTQAKSNAEAATLTYLAPTRRTYIRTIYRKISRTQAVLWGVGHGFTPDHCRIEHWRGGS
jgi:DNA-binding NarL/FixJ family response regulator